MWIRTANKAQKMVAKAIRNLQVPAYCSVELGVQDEEWRGVLVEVKNVIVIESIPIIIILDDEDMGMELPVELAMDIPDMVFVGDVDIDIVMPDLDMLSISIWQVMWYRALRKREKSQ
ncbi:hypothetical protein NA57DRAFT_59022 [Rhizodiscina lignyota]|uniref:Uncharacterized protein n=1 Tax=Rhizodiscina lignyota TaxID=1504668 RepID=A0A9P4IBP7_9PEZI|nr:hypothetical protein NA57DRAFT_59022 [Rhizodiscina lignyota]